ncbi:hypothetical protein MAR_014794 [Mya arenaria]|uniref:Chitin-binding type-2 domain-containing protein n=1 Tax=Mya arenaria TaxID=6604 RepID=A0ABY7FFG6_MYAAR|nr:uncharacterized protein LOC128212101 [Mya arenaria]WAR20820.1 hypothetical protein MAR_014794 [Mya arenaria]
MEGKPGCRRVFLLIVTLASQFNLHKCDDFSDDFIYFNTDQAGPMILPPPGQELVRAPKLKATPEVRVQPMPVVVTTNVLGQGTTPVADLCSQRTSEGGWGYFPFPGSCTEYIQCDRGGSGHVETCAIGTFFNGRKCMRAEDVVCPFDPCKSLRTGATFTDGQTCHGYYRCYEGRSVPAMCTDGSAFNSMSGGCLEDPTCRQTTKEKHPCFAGTTLVIPGRPHMFYLWDGRKGVTEMRCPRGLWYNPTICTCDWIIPGQTFGKDGCGPLFHFPYAGSFLEVANRAPQSPNTAVSIYRKSALFAKGGEIVIWLMNDLDLDSEWALCFEFFTRVSGSGEVALVSNDWRGLPFTFKITHDPENHKVNGYFRMKDGRVVHLVVGGVSGKKPHFLRVAKQGDHMVMRVDNMRSANVKIAAGVASSPTPMVVGAANGCSGFQGFFDELKFFRCVPGDFFSDYKGLI